MKARIAMHTDRGPRENLEDAMGAFSLTRYSARLFEIIMTIVLDGVGGHNYGEVASNIGLRYIGASLAGSMAIIDLEAAFRGATDLILEAMTAALRQANEVILQQSRENISLRGMSTTAVVAVILGDTLYVASVGDSRCYRVGQRRILQVTRDHTEVNRLIEAGLLSPKDAADHPMSHAINRFMGQPTDFSPETYSCRLAPGDMVILTSDGLTDVVTDQEILDVVARCREGHVQFADLPKRLVELALTQGTGDNCTVLCCECVPEGQLTIQPSGRTLTGAYPLQAAQVLRNLKEMKNEDANRQAARKTARRGFAHAAR